MKANKDSLSRILAAEHGLGFFSGFFSGLPYKKRSWYKRQLLTLFTQNNSYNRITEGKTDDDFIPRTICFWQGCPGYTFCKLIINLLNA